MTLDGGLPAGGSDDVELTNQTPVEVTVTDESASTGEISKKPSLGRSHRVGGGARVGLQRHLKRESLQQGDTTSGVDVNDKDAVAVAANVRRSLDGKPLGVTLSDVPVRE
jgi:hypothetical protein